MQGMVGRKYKRLEHIVETMDNAFLSQKKDEGPPKEMDSDGGRYGSVTKECDEISARRRLISYELLSAVKERARRSTCRSCSSSETYGPSLKRLRLDHHQNGDSSCHDYIDLDDDNVAAAESSAVGKMHGKAQGISRVEIVPLNQNIVAKPVDSLSQGVIDLVTHVNAYVASPSKKRPRNPMLEDLGNSFEHLDVSDSEVEEIAGPATFGPLDSSLAKKDVNNHKSVIILDSEEEDAGHEAGIEHDFCSDPGNSEFQAWLGSQMKERLNKQNHVNTESKTEDDSACVTDNKLVEASGAEIFRKEHQTSNGKEDGNAPNLENLIEARCGTEDVNCEKEAAEVADAKLRRNKCCKKNGESQDDATKKLVAEESKTNQTTEFPLRLQENSFGMQFQDEEQGELQCDGLEELWRDMSLAMESSKVMHESTTSDDPSVKIMQQEEECDHSFMLRDEFGLVCVDCGLIQKHIETIFDYQWSKGIQSIRTYASTPVSKYLNESLHSSERRFSEDDPAEAKICIHPRHVKQMKPHQLEGFNFLVKNLVNDRPGGCILAHAPGSGKTFMLISFIQSFLATYPSKRPLVVLPRGILPTWRSEIKRWQVEDMPVHDFYSSKADNRSQQLEVLKLWREKKSILMLGYKQFSSIICGDQLSKVSDECREILLKVPSLLILDEGHTPRNKETDVLQALAKVQTPCKVVLSGTLFQNHVREVFNILDLVRPKFLKIESSRAIVNRIQSRMHISGGKRQHKGSWESQFCDLIQENLQKTDNSKRSLAIIQDLRELTKDVLHYYKGDILEELPGLVDFTVLLDLSLKQKAIVPKVREFELFKRISVGNCVYIHPYLYETAEKDSGEFSDEKIDAIIDSINIRDGVKTKFFLNIVDLAESAGEKLLAFSQYILPLKFLERVLMKTKGWQPGKEIFMISGDSSSELRERSMKQFNNSPYAKVFFGSIKACGEGISLVGASRVVILDIHLNPSVTRQAIGRAFRPGQTKKVYTYRLVAADSPEEELHHTSFSKELISKLWFESNEYCGHQDFQLDATDTASCQDLFFESPALCENVKALYVR